MLSDYQGVIPASNIPAGGNVSAFYPGDVLLSNIRPYLKKVWQANFIGGCSTDVMVIKAKKFVFDKFLYFIIANDSFINYAMSGAKGVKMPRGDKEQLMKYELSTPSIDEQKKIASLLTLIDQRIAIQNRVIKDLKKLKAAFCREALKTLECIPKSRLGKHCTIVTGKLDANAMSDSGQYMFFTCARENYHTDTYAFDGDALLISGNGELGLCKFYSGKFNAYQRTYVLQHFDIDIQFAKLMIDAYLPQKIHKEKNVGAMPYIVLSTLSDLQIPIPDVSVQNRISSVSCTIDETISVEESMLAKSNTVKQYLLSRMFI